jgi:hypothetical protein
MQRLTKHGSARLPSDISAHTTRSQMDRNAPRQ